MFIIMLMLTMKKRINLPIELIRITKLIIMGVTDILYDNTTKFLHMSHKNQNAHYLPSQNNLKWSTSYTRLRTGILTD